MKTSFYIEIGHILWSWVLGCIENILVLVVGTSFHNLFFSNDDMIDEPFPHNQADKNRQEISSTSHCHLSEWFT